MLLNNLLSVIHLHCQAKAQAYHDRWSSIIRDSGHRPSGMSTSCMADRSPCVLFSIIIWCRDVLFICCLLHLSKCREGEGQFLYNFPFHVDTALVFFLPCFVFYALSFRGKLLCNKDECIVFFFLFWIFHELYLICLTIRVSFFRIRVTW